MGVEVGISASYANNRKSLCWIRAGDQEPPEVSDAVDGSIEAGMEAAKPACRTFRNLGECGLSSALADARTRVFCPWRFCRVENSNAVVASFSENLIADLADRNISVETRGPSPDLLRNHETESGV